MNSNHEVFETFVTMYIEIKYNATLKKRLNKGSKFDNASVRICFQICHLKPLLARVR